jgi:predicted enzyme related to lactoylglutathione lyase
MRAIAGCRTIGSAVLAALALVACTATLPNASKGKTMARLDYVELPATDIAATRSFYERAFGWTMTQFAPTYSATTTGDTDVGLQSSPPDRPDAPLPVIQVKDLEASLAAVEGAGGHIVKPIRSFPGGRRFHFKDPSGNELAVWQVAAE